MSSVIAFLSERDQILKVDAPVRTRSMKRNLSLIEQAHKKLPGYAEEVRGLLRGYLLGCGGERDRFAVREIIKDLQEKSVELFRERDLVESPMALTITFNTAPEFGHFRFLCVRNGGPFEK